MVYRGLFAITRPDACFDVLVHVLQDGVLCVLEYPGLIDVRGRSVTECHYTLSLWYFNNNIIKAKLFIIYCIARLDYKLQCLRRDAAAAAASTSFLVVRGLTH